MAIQRQYEQPNFSGRDTRQVQEQRVAGAGASGGPLRAGDDQWQARLLTGLGQGASATMSKLADIEFSNAYLEGQAQAGVIQSEDELQGDPITRDWKVAGYRDTMGKLALADNEAQFQLDLPTLRQQSPEELQQYLAERRNRIMPAFASMSRDGRAAMAGQMLLQDRSAMTTYTTEHKKFIVEQRMQAESTLWGTQLRSFKGIQDQAAIGQTSPEAFNEQLRSTAGTAAATWFDPSLTTDVKQEITYRKMQAALNNDSVALYEYLANTAIPDGNGGESTLLSRLPFEQQSKLANQYREARSRTADARNLFRTAQVADLEAQIDAGHYNGTLEELTAQLGPMVVNKSMTGERYGSIINKYLDKRYKLEGNAALGEMLQRGDVNGILTSDKSIGDAVNALESTMARRNVPPGQRLRTWLDVGLNGVDQGFKKAGETLGVALRQIQNSKDNEVLPQHLEVFRTINDSVRRAESNGLANSRVAVLSGLGEQDRMFAEQVLRLTDDGASLDDAVSTAKNSAAKDEGLSPSMRAARATENSKELSKAINSLEPMGLFASGWNHVKAAFGSADATADLALRPRSYVGSKDGWFSDSGSVQFYAEQSRDAIRAEADNTAILRPGATPAEVLNVAKANVAARTIQTQNGPVIFPRNTDYQAVFGVAPGNQAAIGPAIDTLLKSQAPDSRWRLTFAQGRLFAQEYDKQGERVGNGRFIEAEVRGQIENDYKRQREEANYHYGTGKRQKVGDTVVQFSGNNSAGVPAGWMFGLRQNLVDHEGVKDTPYKDLSGNKDASGQAIMTVGVGVSSTNTHYPKAGPDGKVSQADINLSFLAASDDAAKSGASISRQIGQDNVYAFQLFSEIAYQSGPGFLNRKDKTGDTYRAFVGTMQGTDTEAAKAAFKRTAAWYYSADPKDRNKVTKRQQSYLNQIDNAMKG